MGMFDKDKLYSGLRLDQEFELGQEFIVADARVLPDVIPTEVGDATKTVLAVAKMDEPHIVYWVGTLASAIADKAKDAEPDKDFPAVCITEKVPGNYGKDAFVLSFCRPYVGDIGEVPEPEYGKADIPF